MLNECNTSLALPFDARHCIQEFLHLRLGAEAHHAFDSGAIIIATVEDYDLARGREMGM
jgi:hypothetical protein